MRNVSRNTVPRCNRCCLLVIVSEAEIWPRDAAVGEYPVSGGNGMTDLTLFSYSNQSFIEWFKRKCHIFNPHMHPCSSQLLYTGIVIYAPALILNQGKKDQMLLLSLQFKTREMLIHNKIHFSLYWLVKKSDPK